MSSDHDIQCECSSCRTSRDDDTSRTGSTTTTFTWCPVEEDAKQRQNEQQRLAGHAANKVKHIPKAKSASPDRRRKKQAKGNSRTKTKPKPTTRQKQKDPQRHNTVTLEEDDLHTSRSRSSSPRRKPHHKAIAPRNGKSKNQHHQKGRKKNQTHRRKPRKHSKRRRPEKQSSSSKSYEWVNGEEQQVVISVTPSSKSKKTNKKKDWSWTVSSTSNKQTPRQQQQQQHCTCCTSSSSSSGSASRPLLPKTQETSAAATGSWLHYLSVGGAFAALLASWALRRYNQNAAVSNLVLQAAKEEDESSYFLRPLRYADYTLFPTEQHRHHRRQHKKMDVTMLPAGALQGVELFVQVLTNRSQRIILKRLLSNGSEQALVVRLRGKQKHSNSNSTSSSSSSSKDNDKQPPSKDEDANAPHDAHHAPPACLQFVDFDDEDEDGGDMSWQVEFPESGYYDPDGGCLFDIEQVAVRLAFEDRRCTHKWYMSMRIEDDAPPTFTLIRPSQLRHRTFSTLFTFQPSNRLSGPHGRVPRASLSEKLLFALKSALSSTKQ